MQLHPKFKQFLPTILTFLLLTGCGSQPVKDEIPPGQTEIARQLYDAGDYTAAAAEFLKLAESTPSTLKDDTPSLLKQDYQISAAEAYIKAGDSLKARKIVVAIDRSSLTQSIDNSSIDDPLLLRYDLVSARIAELDQQPEQVVQLLSQISITDIDAGKQKEILQMRIAALETLESPVEAARSRTQIDPLLESDPDQDENRRAIWSTIDQLDPEMLTQLQGDPQEPLAGWVELSLIAGQSLFDATTFNEKVDQWRIQYPDHPAETPILVELLEKSEALGKKISTIALLLPQNGRFAQAGAAVRDGFLSAWYGENNQTDQPMVHVYDADADNILDAYQQAIEEGAELVVGPLEKDALKKLLSLSELPVTTLALNQLSDNELSQSLTHIESDRLFQFGLSPEQEAGQVAEKAWAEGYSHALAITPEGAWGDRLANAFKNKYEELGGIILEHQQYATSTSDYSSPVMQLLNIDGSQQRYDALTNELNRKVKFEPRPRKDMDFIFMAALPVQARQIRPQLLFHRASGVPVITTSHAFGLPPRGEPDLDMEGVIVGDMPWMIRNQEIDPEIPLSMQQNWPDDNAAFLRLFALGIDAYKIIPQLGRLKLQVGGKFEGETGNLSMNENAQIQRDLAWAKFLRGKPQLIQTQFSRSNSETERPADQ